MLDPLGMSISRLVDSSTQIIFPLASKNAKSPSYPDWFQLADILVTTPKSLIISPLMKIKLIESTNVEKTNF